MKKDVYDNPLIERYSSKEMLKRQVKTKKPPRISVQGGFGVQSVI